MNRWQVVGRIAVVALFASAYWWGPLVLRPMSFFGVRRVLVSGTRYLAPDDVVQALGLRPDASVFDDLGKLERRLAAVSGIETASVRRDLPATLRVTISEVEPVALAEGPEGLVPLAKDAKPLPYDVLKAPVDAPIVRDAEPALLVALRQVQTTDLGLFADIAAARSAGGEVVLDLTHGRVRLDLPVDPEIVRSVSAVRRDLEARRVEWRELDGRFRGWVVVRSDGQVARQPGGQSAVRSAPRRAPATPRRTRAVRPRATGHLAALLPGHLNATRQPA